MPTEANLPTVSIIIPTYQGGRYLDDTLTALRAQVYRADVEIIAVDSESTDNTLELLQRYGVTVISIPNRQFSHGYARNLGARRAKGALLVFMSQDALPVGTDWLRGLAESLRDPIVGAVYARQLARPQATPLEEYFHLELYPPRSAQYALQPGTALPLDKIFFSNVCSAARRDVCLAHPFDEALIMSEDQAFAKSLLMAGLQTCYNADVQVIHSHHYDLKTLFRRNFDSAYSLRGVSDDTWLYTIRKAVSYVSGEIAFVIRGGHWRWLLMIPIYEITRVLGRVFGKYAHRLPMRWRTALSLHSGFWTREIAREVKSL